MGICLIEYNGHKFDSEEELDIYLRRYQVPKVIKKGAYDDTFAVDVIPDPVQRSNEILKEAIQEGGKRFLKVKFDQTIYTSESNLRTNSKETMNSMAITTLQKFWFGIKENTYANARKKYKDQEAAVKAGDDWDKILTYEVLGVPIPNNLKGKTAKENFFKILPNDPSDPTVQALCTSAKKIVADIKRKHGKNAILYTFNEVKGENGKIINPNSYLRSVRLSQKLRDILTAQDFVLFGKANDADLDIHCKPDLLVIDSEGRLHVYDFKTSRHEFGNWATYNHTDTKRAYEFQLFTEGAILEQYRLEVEDYTIIPALTKYTGSGEEGDEYVFETMEVKEGFIPIPLNNRALYGRNIFPSELRIENEDALLRTNKKLNILFPEESLGTARLDYNLTADDFYKEKQPLTDSDVDSIEQRKGNTHKVLLKSGTERKYLYFKVDPNNEEKSKKIFAENITEYLLESKQRREEELTNLADTIKNALATNTNTAQGKDAVLTFCNGINAKHGKEVANTIVRYISNRWQFLRDDALNQNGFFIFTKDGICDIVMIDKGGTSLTAIRPLKFGKQIIGNFLPDQDSRMFLASSYGHILMMKAMLYISENKDFFKDLKVNNIVVTTLHPSADILPRFSSYFAPKLIENFNILITSAISAYSDSTNLENKNAFDLNKNLLYENQFTSILERAILNSTEILSSEFTGSYNQLPIIFNKASLNKYDNDVVFLYDAIKDLKYQIPSLKETETKGYGYNHPEVRALYELQAALAFAFKGWDIMIVEDSATHAISPASESTSPNDRTLQEIGSYYFRSITMMTRKLIDDWMAVSSKWHGKSLSGTEYRQFTEWFVLGDDNKPTKDFKIKDFSDLYWVSHPEEKKLAKKFLDTLAVFKAEAASDYRTIPVENVIGDKEWYYQVPLMKTNFLKGISQGAGWDMLKYWGKESIDIVTQIYSNSVISEAYRAQLNRIDVDILPNPSMLEATDRESILNAHEIGFFETDLDKVMLYCSLYHARRIASKTFLPIFAFMRTGLVLENFSGGHILNKTKDWVDKWVRSTIFMQDLDPDGLQIVKALFSKLRELTSFTTLAFSTASGVKELTASGIRTIVESHGPALSNIDPEAYLKELNYMLTHEGEQLDFGSLNNYLNMSLGMANASLAEIANDNPNKGFMNWSGDLWYIMQTFPDYVHRVAVARQLLARNGSLEAFERGEDGWTWEYKMEKDKRWEILFKYKTREEVPIEERGIWNDKRAEYINSLRKWRARTDDGGLNYLNLKEPDLNSSLGDYLPFPLDPDEQNSIKNAAEILYGNYDTETKSLIQKQLLGTLFFQFKTYGIARMWEWGKPAGSINIMQNQDVLIRNEDGEQKKAWKVALTDEEMERNGGNPFKVVLEDSPEFQQAIEENRPMQPWKINLGNPLEGRLQSLFSLAVDLYHWNDADWEKALKDPMKRANIIFSLHDMVWMSILAILIKALFGEEVVNNLNEQDWYTRWAYSVLIGITREGPIWQTATSLIGDGLPPSISIAKRYVASINSVFNGNTNAFYAFTNMFGATRELSNLWNE